MLVVFAKFLGFLQGSNCPHYDGEPLRRPCYHRFISLLVAGLIYLAFRPHEAPPPQPAPVSASPSHTVIATLTTAPRASSQAVAPPSATTSGTPLQREVTSKTLDEWLTWDIPQKRDKSWPPPPGAGNYAGEEARNGAWPSAEPVIEGYNDGYPGTSPVGSFPANQFGLHDMGGNVWQWCEDWYNFQKQYRVWRGASWEAWRADAVLASYRRGVPPNLRSAITGFRCVVAVESSR